MKLIYKTLDNRYYDLSEKEIQAVKDFLNKKIDSRKLGKTLGVSHQTALSAVAIICRQWVLEGKLNIK